MFPPHPFLLIFFQNYAFLQILPPQPKSLFPSLNPRRQTLLHFTTPFDWATITNTTSSSSEWTHTKLTFLSLTEPTKPTLLSLMCSGDCVGLGLWVCVRGSSTWLGLRLGWWVLVGVENEMGGGWLRWVAVAEAWVFGFDGFCLLWPPWVLGLWVLFAALSSAFLSSSHGEASLSQV